MAERAERATRSLLDCLLRRDPAYLEHLETRGSALAGLAVMDRAEIGEAAARRLESVRELSEEVMREARKMRKATLGELSALERHRGLARSLGALSRGRAATLDVKA